MNFGSVCSGIEAASSAWLPLGWKPVFYSEIEPFPSAVLAHRHPDVPNLGDMTKFKGWPDANLDVLVGGTPCQSFSIAGLREGLDDPRGSLMLTYAAIARRYRPGWVVWENVPGVLSSNGGRDFASLLAILSGRAVECPADGWKNSGVIQGIEGAYGLAWRVLDAQYFGVPQRRRRVFVVGYLGDWRCAAAALLERSSLRGDPPPRRPAPQDVAGTVTSSAGRRRGGGQHPADLVPEVANPLTARMHKGVNTTMDEGQTMIGQAIAWDEELNPTVELAGTVARGGDGGRHAGVAVSFKASHFTRGKDGAPSEVAPPLSADADRGDQDTLVAFSDLADPLTAQEGRKWTHEGKNNFRLSNVVRQFWRVRRLTPLECERLQGFADGHTLIQYPLLTRSGNPYKRPKLAKDGPRYKALGNSMAVPVMRWLGRRIQAVTELKREEACKGL